MDTIKILLGVTVALLLGALAMSWKNFQHDQRNEPEARLSEVRKQIGEIRAEQERLRQERDRLLLGSPEVPADHAAAPAPEIAEVPLAADPGLSAVPELFPVPDPLPPAPGIAADQDGQRAKAILEAPVVAKVTEWVEDKDIGTFATVEILVPASLKPGTVVCLRRNAGILGRLKVSEITPEGAIADPLTAFGDAKPKPGDELILEPVK